jgi:hypothetical protein
MRFSGHESFACRYAWIPKALQAIRVDANIFAQEDQAMVELGIGKNMVRSIRFWVEAAGMAMPCTDGSLRPTSLGELIFKSGGLDPYMEDVQTLWLIHWNLSTHIEDPIFAWEFLFSRWQESEFTESSILKAFARETMGKSRRLSPVTLEQHLQVFLHTYLPTRGRKGDVAEDNLDCPLTELEMLRKVGDRESASGQQRREAVYAFSRDDKPSINQALFAYCVLDFWDKLYPNEQTVSVQSLVSGVCGPGQVFKIPEQDIFARLPDLESITGGKVRYSDSAALPQIQRVGALKREQLLVRAYH